MSKQFWGVIAIIVLILGGVFFISNSGKSEDPAASKTTPTNNVEGLATSKVTLVEYGDFQCPYCGQFYPIVKQVVETNKDKIQFQFRNLPLSQIHRNAFAAARAAQAASLQGKFWDMYDKLYTEQDPNGQTGWVAEQKDPLNNYFVGYAQQIGLDTTKFKKDFASKSVNNSINADVAEFKKNGLDESTPMFFINGKRIQPTYDVASFQKAIDAELKAQAAK